MKKLFIAALIVLAAGSSAFASETTKTAAPDVTNVSRQMKSSFNVLFPRATNVSWEQSEQFLSASFTEEDENYTAFFGKDGDLIGTSRKIELNQLPVKALKKIRKNYASFKITEALEFTRDEVSNFYVMIEEGNRKQILEVNTYGNISVFKGK